MGDNFVERTIDVTRPFYFFLLSTGNIDEDFMKAYLLY
jgi:hypothetical protein